jgi:D-alanyl-lipoteichoic acid acyltransferase DltB (MBOAT superfamily)
LRNLLIVMFLGGLWHGAAWTFAVWGLLHGVFLVVHAVASGAGLTPRSVIVNRAITFDAVVAAFVIFRAATLSDAIDVLSGMAGLHGIGVVSFGVAYALTVAALLVFVNVAPNTWEITVRPTPRVAAALGLVAAFSVLQIAEPSPFLYFQF